MIDKPICPFCGTNKLKFFARIAGGYNRHYIGQFHCLKCGARSPHVNSRKMDYREHLTQAEEIELQKQALQAFQPRKDEAPDLWLGCSPDNAAKNCVSLSKAIFERDKRK